MLHFPRWQVVVIVVVSMAAIILSLPNLMPAAWFKDLPSWLPLKQMPLGLDLQGGSHVLLRMNTDELRDDWLKSIEGEVRKTLRQERIRYADLKAGKEQVRVVIGSPEETGKALTKLKGLAQPLSSTVFTGSSTVDLDVVKEGDNVILLRPTPQAFSERITSAMGGAIETIRRRVDALGTTEPSIQREGRSRILVQVPGYNDPEQLKAIIGKTAKLTFQLVDTSMRVEEAQAGRAPAGSAVYPSVEDPGVSYLLYQQAIVSGEDLVDAQPGFDQQRASEAVVTFRFNTSGARRFGQVTKENVGRIFAIVLDGKVISAPEIREPILGGQGQISGNFTSKETTNLALLLRSGALPASLDIVEERTVGPSLGADSIEAGKLATIIGFIGITIFMIAGYGLFGVFALIALIVNLALIVAALSVLQATLTLPGIAGMVLTMGMSLDANVLINERIRDELRLGKSPIAAIETGFVSAYGTITDTNLTGLLAGIIMFWLGSGPVRGFAVTLSIGIIASAFTATTVTRYLVVQWIKWARPTAVPI